MHPAPIHGDAPLRGAVRRRGTHQGVPEGAGRPHFCFPGHTPRLTDGRQAAHRAETGLTSGAQSPLHHILKGACVWFVAPACAARADEGRGGGVTHSAPPFRRGRMRMAVRPVALQCTAAPPPRDMQEASLSIHQRPADVECVTMLLPERAWSLGLRVRRFRPCHHHHHHHFHLPPLTLLPPRGGGGLTLTRGRPHPAPRLTRPVLSLLLCTVLCPRRLECAARLKAWARVNLPLLNPVTALTLRRRARTDCAASSYRVWCGGGCSRLAGVPRLSSVTRQA